ncbi:DUF2399 domain-containing protein [Mesorhizobium sp. WSM2561]|uniref:DUF2399 domain-containing protein n=1 Tax=Mesorhizobium sp. WSM2561 TaxID=1040985 RepID=UPI0004885CBC|nr:DUF2399 domain-containing protein [Mesorhizobium sp. WSM2561]
MKGQSIIDAVEGVTKKWAKQRRAEERAASARANRRQAMKRWRPASLIEAAAHILPQAWAKASGDGLYPASARQIYYAARGALQEITGKPVNYGYFSQSLLPDYIERYGLHWDVVYDARGTYFEPHGKRPVPIGTLQVRKYLATIKLDDGLDEIPNIVISRRFPTSGPQNRFGAILFIEKEGFKPLLDAARIAERFDIAIMSTKGMSVTASRQLIEELCADHEIPLLVLHDFDVSGFTIAGTLQESTRRYEFTRPFKVIDLGLRLADVEGLEPEDVFFKDKADLDAIASTLHRYGATKDESAFLLERQQRVELNAMTSPDFVAFLERKLTEAGVRKVVPDRRTLELAARRAAMIAEMQKAIREVSKTSATVSLPKDLERLLRRRLEKRPELPWDVALLDLMGADDSGDDPDDDSEDEEDAD